MCVESTLGRLGGLCGLGREGEGTMLWVIVGVGIHVGVGV